MSPSLLQGLLIAVVVGAVRGDATTWMVTVQYDPASTVKCTTPSNCTFPGALLAANLNDTVTVKTDVVLSGTIEWRTYLDNGESGTVHINGGGHSLTGSGYGSARAITMHFWNKGQTVKISDLTFANFTGPSRTVICQSALRACDHINSEELQVASTNKGATAPRHPPPPTLILEGVTFYNNTTPEGLVNIWDFLSPPNALLGLLVNQCTFVDNTIVQVGDRLSYAGMLLSMSTTSRVVESLFQGNKFSTSLFGLPFFSDFDLSISQVKAWDNTFVGTTYTGNDGAGFVIRAGLSALQVEYSTFERNPGAVQGIRAQNLTMLGTFLQTPESIYGQVSATRAALGECSITTTGGTASVLIDDAFYNRNPGSSNLNISISAIGCSGASSGPVGCQTSLPCVDIVSPDDSLGSLLGYKCSPA